MARKERGGFKPILINQTRQGRRLDKDSDMITMKFTTRKKIKLKNTVCRLFVWGSIVTTGVFFTWLLVIGRGYIF
jgi:hypothetical protein